MASSEWHLHYSLFATPYSLKSHRPVGLHIAWHVDAELDLADRLDDVVAEQLGEAGIAPIGHVQAVGDDEIVDRDRLLLMPFAHHLETRNKADMAELGDLAEQLHHLARAFRALVDPWRILRIDQHQIGARCLNALDPFFH